LAYCSTIDLIHNTPVVKLSAMSARYGLNLYAKLEGESPGGSMKDRVALHCVQRAEERRQLFPGQVLVESTSGSLGVGLAIVGAMRGYRVVCVIDPKVTTASVSLMRQFGAETITVHTADDTGSYLRNRLELVADLCKSDRNYWWLNQYGNPDNPETHFMYTGPELLRDLGTDLDWVVIPVGTGGLLGGLSRYLKERMAQCRILAVDAVGSIALGGSPGPRRLVGIGSSRRSRHVDMRRIDALVHVTDQDAFLCARDLAVTEGLCLGGSSGAAFAAIVKNLHLFAPQDKVVFIAADSGFKYLDTIYNDSWIESA
jgi:2,3-diaminopropionate biosynthesis protein SbnA